MKRLGRWTFNGAAALSALLGFITIILRHSGNWYVLFDADRHRPFRPWLAHSPSFNFGEAEIPWPLTFALVSIPAVLWILVQIRRELTPRRASITDLLTRIWNRCIKGRIKRHLFTGFSMLSLLLSATILAAWVRSHWVDTIWYGGGDSGHSYNIRIARGELWLFRMHLSQQEQDIVGHRWSFSSSGRPSIIAQSGLAPNTFITRLGFFFANTDRMFAISVADWLPVLLLLIPPSAWLIHRRRDRAKLEFEQKHICTTCGYDLRATPDKCPECGTPVSAL